MKLTKEKIHNLMCEINFQIPPCLYAMGIITISILTNNDIGIIILGILSIFIWVCLNLLRVLL